MKEKEFLAQRRLMEEFWVLGDQTEDAYMAHTKCNRLLRPDIRIQHPNLQDLLDLVRNHTCSEETQ